MMKEKSLCEINLELIAFVAQLEDEKIIRQLQTFINELVERNLSDSTEIKK